MRSINLEVTDQDFRVYDLSNVKKRTGLLFPLPGNVHDVIYNSLTVTNLRDILADKLDKFMHETLTPYNLQYWDYDHENKCRILQRYASAEVTFNKINVAISKDVAWRATRYVFGPLCFVGVKLTFIEPELTNPTREKLVSRQKVVPFTTVAGGLDLQEALTKEEIMTNKFIDHLVADCPTVVPATSIKICDYECSARSTATDKLIVGNLISDKGITTFVRQGWAPGLYKDIAEVTATVRLMSTGLEMTFITVAKRSPNVLRGLHDFKITETMLPVPIRVSVYSDEDTKKYLPLRLVDRVYNNNIEEKLMFRATTTLLEKGDMVLALAQAKAELINTDATPLDFLALKRYFHTIYFAETGKQVA
jgi:hypothetical protein